MFTNNTGAISYELKYKHKLSLCAGVSYDVSGWARTQQASRQAYNPEGCRVTALLSDQQAFTDRIGYWDWPQYRYIHGVVTPTKDMLAELVFRVDCSVPQYSLPRARGIKLDAVAVVPVSVWSLPAEAIPSRTTTAYTMDGNGNEVGPITLSPTHTPCAAQAVVLAQAGCVLYDEQMPNGGFELCANMYYALIDPVEGYQWTQETSPLNFTVVGLVAPYGIQSDEVHSGQNALRVVFKDDVKDVGVRLLSQTYIRTCVERSYVWSFWAKQGKNNACTVAFNFANVNQGTFTPGSEWTKHEGRMDIPQGGATNSENSLDWLINCATGGMDSRVLIDDISFKQVNDRTDLSDPIASSPLSSTIIAATLSTPQAPSATITASSTPAPESSSSTISTITSAPLSVVPSATPSSCTPIIVNRGFENFVQPPDAAPTLGFGTSDDWSYTRDFYTQENDKFWANAGFGPAYIGDVYTAYTNSTTDAVYDIKYKHPISLCAGVSYDISGWVRSHRRNSVWSEGCRVTAMLNGQQAFSDRIGWYDWSYRYVHGTITPAVDVSDAELYFRVTCRAPQVSSSAPRGIKLDEVAVVPAGQWTLPAAATRPTAVTSVHMEEPTPTQIFPFPTACYSTAIYPAYQGCVLYDEQIPDPGFEVCSYDNWIYAPPGNRGDYETVLPIDRQLTQIVTDEKHGGEQSLRVVFNSTGGSVGVHRSGALRPCVERSYVYSLWAKQAAADACTVEYWWGAILRASFTPPVGSWAKLEGRADLSPFGAGIQYDGYVEVRINCPSAGGLSNAVWLDDVSHQQVPYTGPMS
jgi:hypothetical protein